MEGGRDNAEETRIAEEPRMITVILEIFAQDMTVCTVKDLSQTDLPAGLCFIGVTPEENSLVCETGRVPNNTIRRDDGWRMFRVSGELDFGLVGILAEISVVLADAGVPLFAVSTYATDYILVKSEYMERAISALEDAGHAFRVLPRSSQKVLSTGGIPVA